MDQSTLFTATQVAFEVVDELNAVVLIVAEAPERSETRVEFQRSIELDEEDWALGMATYCVCLANSACHYGGLEQWWISEDTLHLRFADGAGRALGVALHSRIRLSLSPDQLAVVAHGLTTIVGASAQAR